MKGIKYKVIMTILIMLIIGTGCRDVNADESVKIVESINPNPVVGKQIDKECELIEKAGTKEEIKEETEKEEMKEADSKEAGTEERETEEAAAEEVKQDMITMIGDSIMLSASEELLEIMPDCVINARKNRQVEEGIEIVKELELQEKVGDIVVIALGTNGMFTDDVAEELLECLGEERRIYWVTAYGKNLAWRDEVNEKIRQMAEQYDNIRILDWEVVAAEHMEWFCEDGIHLNTDGQNGYAQFIAGNF